MINIRNIGQDCKLGQSYEVAADGFGVYQVNILRAERRDLPYEGTEQLEHDRSQTDTSSRLRKHATQKCKIHSNNSTSHLKKAKSIISPDLCVTT